MGRAGGPNGLRGGGWREGVRCALMGNLGAMTGRYKGTDVVAGCAGGVGRYATISRMRILVIEDDEDLADALVRQIGRAHV